jgi:hypothetical protein
MEHASSHLSRGVMNHEVHEVSNKMRAWLCISICQTSASRSLVAGWENWMCTCVKARTCSRTRNKLSNSPDYSPCGLPLRRTLGVWYRRRSKVVELCVTQWREGLTHAGTLAAGYGIGMRLCSIRVISKELMVRALNPVDSYRQ